MNNSKQSVNPFLFSANVNAEDFSSLILPPSQPAAIIGDEESEIPLEQSSDVSPDFIPTTVGDPNLGFTNLSGPPTQFGSPAVTGAPSVAPPSDLPTFGAVPTSPPTFTPPLGGSLGRVRPSKYVVPPSIGGPPPQPPGGSLPFTGLTDPIVSPHSAPFTPPTGAPPVLGPRPPISRGATSFYKPEAPNNFSYPNPSFLNITPVESAISPSVPGVTSSVSSISSPVSGIPFGSSPEDFGSPSSSSTTYQTAFTASPESAHTTVLPASFESMASNPPMLESTYHPVIHHWFYSRGKTALWYPYSFTDSINLEEGFRQNSGEVVAVEGGRYDVNLPERVAHAVYWEQEPSPVRRCSWFKKSQLDARPIPYEEHIAEKLEAEYSESVKSGRWHRQVDLESGDRVMIHSPRSMLHYPLQAVEDINAGVSVGTPQNVYRGMDNFEITDGEADQVDHLMFLVHGIGSACDLRFRAVEECVDDFRKLGLQLLSSHFKQNIDSGLVGRVEILPISWHKALHGDATGLDKKLKSITLRSIPKLREFTNDTLLDILFFTSPVYCQHIMDTVNSEMNRIHKLFKERHPNFNGHVSLGGHSLGSTILFDLLMHQPADNQATELENNSENKEDSTPLSNSCENSVTSSIDYVMGSAGTGQPSIVYPLLSFKPYAFFLMGSPLSMFITVRGIDKLSSNFKLPTCDRVLNIFHPFDPVAYRLETLIDPSLNDLRPVLIPHHKGRKRMHLELKEQIERVGSDLKQKVVESIQSTWNRLYTFYSGASISNVEEDVDKMLEEKFREQEEDDSQLRNAELRTPIGCLNGGRRIDYVLQEKPYESFNEYIFALQAHLTYWESEDTMLLILKELYESNGILCDQAQQHNAAGAYDGDSALGSGSVSPTSPYGSTDPVYSSFTTTASQPPPPPEPIPLINMATVSSPTSSMLPPGPPTMLPSSGTPIMLPPIGPPSMLPPTGPPSMLPPTGPPTMLLPAMSGPPSTQPGGAPRVIGGRPVVDPFSLGMGMDPTADSQNKTNVGPPPTMANFTRQHPFRK